MDFTLGRAAPNAPAASRTLLAVISLVLLASPAAAKAPPSGSTSSASIKISVSVAPRYQLYATGKSQSAGLANASGISFCIATNGAKLLLPAELLRPIEGEVGTSNDGMAADRILVASCGAPEPAKVPSPLQGAQLLIVQPE